MKKSIRLTAVAALAAAGVMVSAGAANFTGAADRLHEVGLFQGTGVTASGAPVYELDRTPTRAEAAVMLVRLLGKEADRAVHRPRRLGSTVRAVSVRQQADHRRDRDHFRAESTVLRADVHHLPASLARLLGR